MLTVSDRIQIPSKTTHKDKGTKINAFHYFISKYSVRVSWDLTYKKRTPDRILSRETVPSREFRQTMASSEKPWAQAARTKNFWKCPESVLHNGVVWLCNSILFVLFTYYGSQKTIFTSGKRRAIKEKAKN